jgi:hypothetical protein
MAAYVFNCSLKCGRTGLHEREWDRQAEIGAGKRVSGTRLLVLGASSLPVLASRALRSLSPAGVCGDGDVGVSAQLVEKMSVPGYFILIEQL